MNRSFARNSMLIVVALSPLACSFETASEAEKNAGRDGGYTSPDINVDVPPADGGGHIESDAAQVCATTQPQTMNLPPDILIVLDRSGSMKDKIDGTTCSGGCGADSKWTQMTDALNLFTPTVEGNVNWGLKLFGSASSCDVNTTAEVAPKTLNAAAIKTQIAKTTPGSSTPTTAAVTKAAGYLAGVNDGNPKFILLATDGMPTCGTAACAPGTVTGNQNQCDDANAIAAVKSVHDTMGIDTFVIGIGTANGGGDATLTAMAQAGGHPRSGTPAYYSVQSASELTEAFKAIVGQVGSCNFALSPAIDPKTQQIMGVKADGALIPASDYTVMGNSSVLLTGQTCADYSSGKIKTVQVQVICIVG
ncbi:MAG TPA: VWA domain-containing protein [Polyangia bacterium]|nr:VWA domain-containing protein [Polyangia bacterium]